MKLSEETKQKISYALKGRKAWNKGLCFDTKYKKNMSNSLKKYHKIHPELAINQSKKMKGIKKSIEHKKNISKSLIGRKFSKEHKKNLSSSRNIYFQNNPKVKEKISYEKKQLYKNNKVLLNKIQTYRIGKSSWNKGLTKNNDIRLKKLGDSLRKHHKEHPETRKKIFKGRIGIGSFCPNMGKNETQILNNIEKEYNITILRQYQILGYFLDGYNKETNIAYEIDEKYHFNKNNKLCKKDIVRQQYIENEIKCNFIRIKDF